MVGVPYQHLPSEPVEDVLLSHREGHEDAEHVEKEHRLHCQDLCSSEFQVGRHWVE